MKDILAYWIMFQLVAIGIAGVQLENRMFYGNLEICERRETSFMTGVIFPLVMFIGETGVDEYCAEHGL